MRSLQIKYLAQAQSYHFIIIIIISIGGIISLWNELVNQNT